MLKTANPFDCKAPAWVDQFACVAADRYRRLPVDLESVTGHKDCALLDSEPLHISSIEPRARLLDRPHQTWR